MLVLTASSAHAHPFDEIFGLRIEALSVEGIDPTALDAIDAEAIAIEIGLSLFNGTDAPVRLYDMRPSIGRRARLFETFRVDGEELERETIGLTLPPGAGRVILPPLARIVVDGVSRETLRRRSFHLTLDFGAAGAPEILLRLAPSRLIETVEGRDGDQLGADFWSSIASDIAE